MQQYANTSRRPSRSTTRWIRRPSPFRIGVQQALGLLHPMVWNMQKAGAPPRVRCFRVVDCMADIG